MARRSHATAQLRREVGARFPLRDTGSDGWIGDAAHRARPSDHNPDSNGVVHAEDFDENDHDGSERVGRTLWDFLLAAKDPRTKYVIYERRMFSSYPVRGYPAWTPRPYSGSNGHLTHLHVSVYGDDGSPWGFATAAEEDDVLRRGQSGSDVKWLQNRLNVVLHGDPAKGLKRDGDYGRLTSEAVEEAKRVLVWGDADGDHASAWFGQRLNARIAWSDDDRKRAEHEAKYHKAS